LKRIYANLIGNWTDITESGTVADHQKPLPYFEENLRYEGSSLVAECFKYDYIHVQYGDRDYRIHPTQIQIVEV
jgi:hypothetical protein